MIFAIAHDVFSWRIMWSLAWWQGWHWPLTPAHNQYSHASFTISWQNFSTTHRASLGHQNNIHFIESIKSFLLAEEMGVSDSWQWLVHVSSGQNLTFLVIAGQIRSHFRQRNTNPHSPYIHTKHSDDTNNELPSYYWEMEHRQRYSLKF